MTATPECAVCHKRDHHTLFSDDPVPDHEFTFGFHTTWTDEMFCPWCGAEQDTSDARDDRGTWTCEKEACERKFTWEIEWTPSYTTTRKA